MHGGDVSGGGRHAGQRLHETLHLVALQPAQRDQLPLPHQLPDRIEDRRLPVRVHVAVRPHDEQPGAPQLARQELQQEQRGFVGRMQIFQDNEQRLGSGGVPEEPGGRLELVKAGRLGLWRRNGHTRDAETLGENRDHLGNVRRPGTQPLGHGVVVVVLGEGTDRLRPRPERRCAPSLPASTPYDPIPSGRRVLGNALRQPGLADPGLAGDQEQSPPPARGVLQAGHQLGHLAVPAHEHPPGCPPHRVLHASVLRRRSLTPGAD